MLNKDDKIYAMAALNMLISSPWPTTDTRWVSIEYWLRKLVKRCPE